MTNDYSMLPVVLFVYNRPEHTLKTLNNLSKNNNIDNVKLFIFSDAPKTNKDKDAVEQVRHVINNFNWPGSSKVIICRKENMGLGKSVIDGVTRVVNEYGKVVVLEDDILTSTSFIDYMRKILDVYENENKVFSVSGYIIPTLSKKDCEDIYFVPRISSWGWATWKDRWDLVDWDITGYQDFIKNKHEVSAFSQAGSDMVDMLINQVEGEAESWAIRFDYNRYRHNGLTIYPGSSLVSNIGSDGSGAHRDDTSKFDVDYLQKGFDNRDFSYKDPILDLTATLEFKKFYHYSWVSKGIILIRRLGLYNVIVPRLKKLRGILK